jgi:hypothetical protein
MHKIRGIRMKMSYQTITMILLLALVPGLAMADNA